MEDFVQDPLLVKLGQEGLRHLPDAVQRPTYDRAALTAGIVHIGLGNFHRAHQAWYLHRLMQQGEAFDWAIVGAGVRPFDKIQRERLAAQDFLTTLIELSPDGCNAEVVGSMIDFAKVGQGNAPLIARMAKPDIRIVALTVTEGGYYIDPATKGFDAAHPDIQRDAANPDSPETAFGAIVAALKFRRDSGIGPFAGLSCDNLQGNGKILRQTVVSLARLSDPDLAEWIDRKCTFPNSMVDCIVPATGPNELDLVRELGVDDAAPVTHEPFRQWVIEDDFCAGRPDWDKVGAIFSSTVHDYEAMKIRILNGGHQVVAAPGEVLSLATIADCIAHEKISALFGKVMREEICPNVKPVPGTLPVDYVAQVHKRFSNRRIGDTTRRVAFDGSSRHPGFLVPAIRDALAAGMPIVGLALIEAVWARMCEGTREDGSTIEPNDPVWDDLTAVAKDAKLNPGVWLEQRQFYGDVADAQPFAAAFAKWLPMIWDRGIEATIDAYLADP